MTLPALLALVAAAALIGAALPARLPPADGHGPTEPLSSTDLAMLFEGWALALQAGLDPGSVIGDLRGYREQAPLARWLRPVAAGLGSGLTVAAALRRAAIGPLPASLHVPWQMLADRAEHGLPLAPHLRELAVLAGEHQRAAAERWAQHAALLMVLPQFLLFLAVIAVCLLPLWGMELLP